MTEETAQQLIERLDTVINLLAPIKSRGKKSKRQQIIDDTIAKLNKKYLKKQLQ